MDGKAEKMVDDKSQLYLFLDTKAPEKVKLATSEKKLSAIPSAPGLSYYERHKKKILKRCKKYKLEHRKIYLQNHRIYNQTHKEEAKLYFKKYGYTPEYKEKNRNKQRMRAYNLTLATIQQVYDDNMVSNGGVLKCIYCRRELELREATLEHKQPLSKSGTNNKDNLAIACEHCNKSKNNKTEKEFRKYLRNNKTNCPFH